MGTSRFLKLLLLVTVVLQAAILSRQYLGPQLRPQQPRVSVYDAPEGSLMQLELFPYKGSAAADIALVEFSDYECPFCARHATEVFPSLEEQFIKTGKVLYAFANNPLSIHANAPYLARVAICAGDQGHYWETHDALFSGQPKTETDVASLLKPLSLNIELFSSCVDNSPAADEIIARDVEIAADFGLTGTPSFAVGRVNSAKELIVQKFIRGAQPVAIFESTIDDLVTAE